MEFTLIDIDTDRHSISYFCLLCIQDWQLFYIEWGHNRVVRLIIFGKVIK